MNSRSSEHRHCRLEKELQRLCELTFENSITLGQIVSETAHHDRALITLILALPFLLPIPLPGLSIPFGLLIAFISFRMFLGKRLWLPDFLTKRTVDPLLARKLFSAAIPLAHRISKWVRPRGSFFLNHLGTRRFSLLCIAICGLLLALPLPPGTNSPPALTIVFLSLGVLEHDGLYLALGYLCFLLISLLFLTLAFWGYPQVIQWFGK